MTTNRTNTASVTGGPTSISLGDLRWLVDQLADGDDSLEVTVHQDHGGHQLDPGSTTMTAQVPPRKKPQINLHHRGGVGGVPGAREL